MLCIKEVLGYSSSSSWKSMAEGVVLKRDIVEGYKCSKADEPHFTIRCNTNTSSKVLFSVSPPIETDPSVVNLGLEFKPTIPPLSSLGGG